MEKEQAKNENDGKIEKHFKNLGIRTTGGRKISKRKSIIMRPKINWKE